MDMIEPGRDIQIQSHLGLVHRRHDRPHGRHVILHTDEVAAQLGEEGIVTRITITISITTRTSTEQWQRL
jgi:hypothetical protein